MVRNILMKIRKWSYVTAWLRRFHVATVHNNWIAWGFSGNQPKTIYMTISPENPKNIATWNVSLTGFSKQLISAGTLIKKVPINISSERWDIFTSWAIIFALIQTHTHSQTNNMPFGLVCIECLDSLDAKPICNTVRRDVQVSVRSYDFFLSLPLGYMLINFHHSVPKTICHVITLNVLDVTRNNHRSKKTNIDAIRLEIQVHLSK